MRVADNVVLVGARPSADHQQLVGSERRGSDWKGAKKDGRSNKNSRSRARLRVAALAPPEQGCNSVGDRMKRRLQLVEARTAPDAKPRRPVDVTWEPPVRGPRRVLTN